MKQILKILAGLLMSVVTIGSLHAYEVYLPHLTAGETGWTDYLQVDNDGAETASFTMTFYADGEVVDAVTQNVASLDRALVNLKELAPTASVGVISYTNESLLFRLSYAYENGGLAEFSLSDTLKSTMGLYFSDFATELTTQGMVVTNFSSNPVAVVLYAVGDGTVLGSHTSNLDPHEKLIGSPGDWFPDVSGQDIQKVIATTRTASLDGIVIGSDSDLSHLIFTSAKTVSGFSYSIDPAEYSVLFYDDFGTNANGWPTGETADSWLRIRIGSYLIDHYDSEASLYTWNSHDPIGSNDNYIIEVTLTNLMSATVSWYGLTWGFEDEDNFYNFSLTTNGRFGVFEQKDAVWTELATGTSNTIEKGNDNPNTLKIVNENGLMTFYINGVPVLSREPLPLFGNKVGFHVVGDQRISVQEMSISTQ